MQMPDPWQTRTSLVCLSDGVDSVQTRHHRMKIQMGTRMAVPFRDQEQRTVTQRTSPGLFDSKLKTANVEKRNKKSQTAVFEVFTPDFEQQKLFHCESCLKAA